MDEIQERIEDLYQSSMPPWWRPLRRRRWRREGRQVVARAFQAALLGAAEPVVRFGVRLDP